MMIDYGCRSGTQGRNAHNAIHNQAMSESDEDETRHFRRISVLKSVRDITPTVRDRMKKTFTECYRAVVACEDETGRKRCSLFRELPNKRVSFVSDAQ
jgi:hypothetical protein